MKKIILYLFISFITPATFAQNNVGIGTTTPNSSAVLDITSTSKGLLVPRMTTAERTAITSPAKGLMVFDNNTSSFWYYDGSTWTSLSASASLTLPYQQSINSSSNAIDISNTGTGAAVKGNSNTAAGIGVYGETASGTGVKGYSNNAGSVAVFGSSLTGTGVKAYSFTGTALDVIGNVKISGGNTNPANGAVLTSDASGNATWKPQIKVAFEAASVQFPPHIPEATLTTLPFQVEVYDTGSNFNPSTAAIDANTFIAPVTGAYHFSARAKVSVYSSVSNIENCTISLFKNGSSIGHSWSGGPLNKSTSSTLQMNIDQTVHLNVGDKIKVVVYQNNGGNLAASYLDASFSGYLIFAD